MENKYFRHCFYSVKVKAMIKIMYRIVCDKQLRKGKELVVMPWNSEMSFKKSKVYLNIFSEIHVIKCTQYNT